VSDFLTNISKQKNTIITISYELENLAQCFETIGNNKVGDKLYYYASTLQKSVEKIEKALSKRIHDDYKFSQQSSVNILNACLATNELNKGE